MQSMIETITAYLHSHSFESEGWGNETVLDQLNQVYWESRESVSPKFKDGFQELGRLLETLPLDDDSGRTCCTNFFSVHMLIFGVGGVITPFIGIKLIDMLINPMLTLVL